MGRAEEPPVFYVQPFVPRPGSACCLKHSRGIQVNESGGSEARFGVFFQVLLVFFFFFVQMADRLSCEIGTSNLGPRKKARKKKLKNHN